MPMLLLLLLLLRPRERQEEQVKPKERAALGCPLLRSESGDRAAPGDHSLCQCCRFSLIAIDASSEQRKRDLSRERKLQVPTFSHTALFHDAHIDDLRDPLCDDLRDALLDELRDDLVDLDLDLAFIDEAFDLAFMDDALLVVARK